MARSRRRKIRMGLAKARPAHSPQRSDKGGKGKGNNRASVGGGKPAPKGPSIGLGGARPAAPAPAPAAPAAPSSPLDSSYYLDVAGAGRQRDSSLAEIAAARDVAERRFGLSGSHADTKANPYSLAALLQDRQQLGQRGVRNSAGLNIYAGSTRQKQTNVDSRYAQGLSDLKGHRDEAIAAFRQQEGEVRRAHERAAEEARREAIARAAAAAPAPVAPPPAPAVNRGTHRGKGKRRYGIGRGRRAR